MSRMPQIGSRELVRFLKSNGFDEDRQAGSHVTLKNHRTGLTLTIPIHAGCDIGRGLVIRILKDAGLTIDDYLNWR